MQKRIFYGFILLAGLVAASPVVAIDGDFGSPYAPDQQGQLVSRAPGEAPAYGGSNAAVPAMTMFGGVLVLLGAVAAAYWQIKSTRLSRTADIK